MTRPMLTHGLAALIHALTGRAGERPVVEAVRSTPWSSITFSGMRHRFTLCFEGEQASAAIAKLADGLDYAEFDLHRHILVDIAITDRQIAEHETRISLEALILAND